MQMLDTCCDKVAVNKVESLGDTLVKVYDKALDYQMADRKAEIKVDQLGLSFAKCLYIEYY